MKRLRPFALALALAAPIGADEVAVPMADGTVLRGERVEDPAVAGRGVRLRTGGFTVFVPWSEMAPDAARAFREGGRPDVPLVGGPPVAPGPGDPATAAPAEPLEPLPIVPGQGVQLPDCCDPRR